MISLLLIGGFLAAPTVCPPDLGIVRWQDVKYQYTLAGKPNDVVGSIWDRDRNSRPSDGDLMRVDSATAGGNAMAVNQVWVVVKGNLAKSLAQRLEALGPELKTECDAPFEVPDVPTVATDAALAKLLRDFDESVPKMTPEQEAEKAMLMWAEERCNKEKYADERTLKDWLLKNGKKSFADLGASKLKKLATELAHSSASKCAHLKGPKISF